MNMYYLISLLNVGLSVLMNRGLQVLVAPLTCKVTVVNKILIFWNISLLEYSFSVCSMFMPKSTYIRRVERKKLVVFIKINPNSARTGASVNI